MKFIYIYLILHDVACIAGAVILIIKYHPWWAALLILLAATTTVGTQQADRPDVKIDVDTPRWKPKDFRDGPRSRRSP